MRYLLNCFILIFILFVIVVSTRSLPGERRIHRNGISHPRRWERWCTTNNECGHGYCQGYICRCHRGFITWTFMEVCNYEQRKKLTAFLVSFFVGILGIDWFVLSRGQAGYIIAGLIKLFISLSCIIGWPTIVMIISKKKPKIHMIINGINVLLSFTSFLWWLTDWIRVLANVFYDGNGVPLQPWGDNSNDRFLYRF